MPTYGHTVLLAGIDVDEATERTTAALGGSGFGVLTTIDVKAVFKAKLDVEVRPYRILGACNPVLASRALELEPHVGLLMPCNVVVRAVEGGTEVSFVDATAQLAVSKTGVLARIGEEADALLRQAADALRG